MGFQPVISLSFDSSWAAGILSRTATGGSSAPDHGLGRVLEVARIQPAGELAQLPRGNTLVHLLADAGVRNERFRHGVHDPAGRNFF